MNAIQSKNRRRPAPQTAYIDPAVETLASLVQRSGLSDSAIAAKVGAARGHPMTPSTVANLRELTTRLPQNYTLSWIGWAVGYTREWRKL
jgi:hypothetical protein